MKLLGIMLYVLLECISFMIVISTSMAGLIVCCINHPNISFWIFAIVWSICWGILFHAFLSLRRGY